MTVYVLISNMDGTDRPVGVVSTEEKALAFYQTDTTNRDYMLFNMDEIVGTDKVDPNAGQPSSLADSTRALTDATRQLEALHSQIKNVNPKKKPFRSSLLRG